VDRTIEQFLNEIKLEGRASPSGFHWDQFYKFLKSRKTESAGDPPIPLILAASGESNARKHERLAQQLDWALRQGILEEAIRFLQQIPVERWNQGQLSKWHADTY
jgi:hypothetical protein